MRRFSNLLWMKPHPLLYDESPDSCVPIETALIVIPRNVTATVAWKIAVWSTDLMNSLFIRPVDIVRGNLDTALEAGLRSSLRKLLSDA